MKIIPEIPISVEPPSERPALRQLRGLPERGRRPLGLIPALLLGVSLLAGCVYHMPIRQGNYLDPAVVAQVKPGMTESQVRFLLGTPMVPGEFDHTRWDYDYYLDQGRIKNKQHAHVTVWFKAKVVTRVVSDVHSPPVTTVTRRGVKYPVPF